MLLFPSLHISSVRVLRRNVPRDEIGRGKPDKKNTRAREEIAARRASHNVKKKGEKNANVTSPIISCESSGENMYKSF